MAYSLTTAVRGYHIYRAFTSSVPLQLGADDCGLYAIAFATELAFSYDLATLHTKKFKQNEMRTHLVSCLQNNYFIDFPYLAIVFMYIATYI